MLRFMHVPRHARPWARVAHILLSCAGGDILPELGLAWMRASRTVLQGKSIVCRVLCCSSFPSFLLTEALGLWWNRCIKVLVKPEVFSQPPFRLHIPLIRLVTTLLRS
jgi:hypothetical protein